MKIEFKVEELISKNGKTYPVVGGRLRIAHELNENLSITTAMISFESGVEAVVKAELQTLKGAFSAYGAASLAKDERLAGSLLELAETRAIARALRFAGYGVEYTGSEEIPDEHNGFKSVKPSGPPTFQEVPPKTTKHSYPDTTASLPQINAIHKICRSHNWKAAEAIRRILKLEGIHTPEQLTKDQASLVIRRMKEALVA